MGRKKKEEEPENHERWMVSYADFLTLLFAFFTCMYAISTIDATKMGQMMASMKASFGGQVFESSSGANKLTLDDGGGGRISISSAIFPDPEVNIDDNLAGLQAKKNQQLRVILTGEADMGRFKRTLETILSEEIKKNQVRIYLERRGIVVSISETGMFDSGSDVIRPDGISKLDIIATSLVNIGNQIRIEGHADSVPINNARFPSNWDLSVARASTVLRRMERIHGLPSELLSASGYGEYRPIDSNSTYEGRARNRRVDIVILNPEYARLEP